MFPRSGGEKVYLEAVYKKPKYLATIIFAAHAMLLSFTAAACIVCVRHSDSMWVNKHSRRQVFANKCEHSQLHPFIDQLNKCVVF